MVRRITKRIELVPNWNKSWKWASIQISTIGLIFFSAIDVIQPLFSSLSKDTLDLIPHGSSITITLFALNIIGRLFRLKPKEVQNGNS